MSDKTLLSQRTMLEEANAFVLEQRKNVNEFYKPLYHFSPPCGWMNDPNGLVYFRGEYHVFYQFHPYSSQGGLMYWGHAKSRNFTTWEHLPIALAPDAPYDKNGCWSGGAIVIEDVLYLIYTGHYDENGERRQTQNIAFSRDGIHFEKYIGNPVIEAASAPMGVSKADFRDPFVWKKTENTIVFWELCKTVYPRLSFTAQRTFSIGSFSTYSYSAKIAVTVMNVRI